MVAAAGTEANPFQQRRNGRSRCAFEVRISCRNCLHVTVEPEKMFEHGSDSVFNVEPDGHLGNGRCRFRFRVIAIANVLLPGGSTVQVPVTKCWHDTF